MLNVAQLLYRSSGDGCFHSRLAVVDSDRAALLAARRVIRDYLRVGIAALTKQTLGSGKTVTPRFLTQGSFAYGTLNDPAQQPPQEIDLDDGTYLPMSLMRGTAPSIASDVFFKIVEGLLEELAGRKGWIIDKSRPTCVRVRINLKSHIDVPLYAIPDSEYQTLLEKSASRGYATLDAAFREAAGADWTTLDSESVWLALRGGKWIKSDPRKVHEWVLRQGRLYGPQYIRLCRYLKAWRDQQWQRGGPSSILLMVCASQALQGAQALRDDQALGAIAKDLARQLSGGVCNAEVDARAELNDLADEERITATAKAGALALALDQAMTAGQDAASAIARLRAVFGERVPNRPDWVLLVTPAALVRTTPASVVAAPAVKRAHSA